MEDYAAKMLLKTDAALREYVTGHVQYREAAVLAALDELRRRGQSAPEEAALRPKLETGAAAQRGCQLSVLVHQRGRDLFEYLAAQGIIGDWREPNVIRLAPVPLYNSFADVQRVGDAIKQFIMSSEQ